MTGQSTNTRAGFTLIELMLVVLLMGMIMANAYPQYQVVSYANLRESSRKVAGTIRYLYARAILDKKEWRLAIDFENNKYWGERLEDKVDLELEDEGEEKDENSPFNAEWAKLEDINESEYSLDGSAREVEEELKEWTKVSTAVLKEARLPKGVQFKDMRALGKDQVTEQIGYIYFSPYGGVERAVIHLAHENHKWVYTLVTKPLSGRVAVFDEDKDIELVPILGQMEK